MPCPSSCPSITASLWSHGKTSLGNLIFATVGRAQGIVPIGGVGLPIISSIHSGPILALYFQASSRTNSMLKNVDFCDWTGAGNSHMYLTSCCNRVTVIDTIANSMVHHNNRVENMVHLPTSFELKSSEYDEQ